MVIRVGAMIYVWRFFFQDDHLDTNFLMKNPQTKFPLILIIFEGTKCVVSTCFWCRTLQNWIFLLPRWKATAEAGCNRKFHVNTLNFKPFNFGRSRPAFNLVNEWEPIGLVSGFSFVQSLCSSTMFNFFLRWTLSDLVNETFLWKQTYKFWLFSFVGFCWDFFNWDQNIFCFSDFQIR